MVERILLKRSVQHRVKTPPNVTFLHICDPVIWFKNQGSYTGFAKEGKVSILWLSYRGSDHLLVIEDDIIEKHLVLLTTPLSPSLAMFRINNLPVRFGVWIAAKIGQTGGCCRREAKVY